MTKFLHWVLNAVVVIGLALAGFLLALPAQGRDLPNPGLSAEPSCTLQLTDNAACSPEESTPR